MRLKMRRNQMRATPPLALSAAAAALLMGCGGSSDAALPQLSAATPATLQSCATLASSLALPDTRITSAEQVPAGPITVQNVTTQAPAHCLVKGHGYGRMDLLPHLDRRVALRPEAVAVVLGGS